MSAIVITGCAPWDGTYEFDDLSFTNRELYEIRKLSGLRAGELVEALEANDTSAFVGVAMVVLQRHGVRLEVDDLWDAKVGSIRLQLGDDLPAEGDASPPPTGLESEPEPTPVGSGSGSSDGGV